MNRVIYLLTTILLLISLTACDDGNSGELNETKSDESVVEDKGEVKDNNADTGEEDKEKSNDGSDLDSESEPQEDKVPREYRNALASAENYIQMMPFSEKGLFEQLTSDYGDGFPEEAAQYAIENLEVDYKEQALRSAEHYLSTMPMSDQQLYEQLVSEHGENYTEEQAQYAIDNLED